MNKFDMNCCNLNILIMYKHSKLIKSHMNPHLNSLDHNHEIRIIELVTLMLFKRSKSTVYSGRFRVNNVV